MDKRFVGLSVFLGTLLMLSLLVSIKRSNCIASHPVDSGKTENWMAIMSLGVTWPASNATNESVQSDGCATELKYNCSALPEPGLYKSGTHPLTSLSSFPGSGNTWTRLLLSTLTGISTGQTGKDSAFKHVPGMVEVGNSSVVAVKTHCCDGSEENLFIHEKQVESLEKILCGEHKELHRVDAVLHDIHLVFYENMKSDLRAESIRMRRFLEVPIDCMRLWCTVTSNQQTKFKRKKHLDKARMYDEEMLIEVEEALVEVNNLIARRFGTRVSKHVPDCYSTGAQQRYKWLNE